jgi:NAD(P)-dependent dehydrogenase (short-subunit alcohol dehydrogenase family)/catechol 2,3-dioxygenase-like lactoylglutathione lyase family enzyme
MPSESPESVRTGDIENARDAPMATEHGHDERVALITGASRGLGEALARALAADGWGLLIDARGAEALEAVRADLARQTRVIALVGDVGDAAHRRALAEAALALGGLDAVVNNASELGPSPLPTLLEYPLEALERVYRTNVLAPLGVLQAVRDALRPGAHILNITSDAGVEAYEGWGGYGSSKAALEQLSHVLAAERPDWRVYWVDPGDMRTAMQQLAFPGEDISDRPLPERSVPGLVSLLTADLPSGRYQARAVASHGAPEPSVRELRVALTVDDFDRMVALYRDGFGLETVQEWRSPEGRGVVLAAGRGTVEILDHADSAYTDAVEAGRRLSGPVRLAFEVTDLRASAAALQAHGAEAVREPVKTTWSDLNQRLQAPDGMQISLFQVGDARSEDTTGTASTESTESR